MPECLFYEIYFDENDDWYLVVDTYLMEILGISSFQELSILSSAGFLDIRPDFLPNTTGSTILTESALTTPHTIYREADYLHVTWGGGNFWFMPLSWGNSPTAPVKGPFPGQSLTPVMVYETQYYDPTFWLVKNSEPYILGYAGNVQGIFQGYLYDQNMNPVPDAQIKYVSDYYTNPPYYFPPLITDQTGHFYDSFMWACNFHLSGIVINGVQYPFIQDISIEPDEVNTVDLYMIITGVEEHGKTRWVSISNYPDPFSFITTFRITNLTSNENKSLRLVVFNLLGQIVDEQEVVLSIDERNIAEFVWKNQDNIKSGIYTYQLLSEGKYKAAGKMIIE